ncbi:MAG: sigma-70 family RNA polymerase sigma factor [Planctomycetales bacterium]|nr:sigma-70 family RNA polymerase sigma factor [Planctomycetales bacterium]
MAEFETRSFAEYQSPDDETPYSLVSALRRGSETAWNKLVQIWGRTIYQFCKSRNLRHEDAEEIVQAVLVKIYRYISEFDRNGKDLKLRYWVFTIVRREIATFCERFLAKPGSAGGDAYQRILQEVTDPASVDDSAADFRNQLVSSILSNIQADFDPRVWQAFEMFGIQKIDGPAVAQQLGMTPNAVRQAAHRVRTRIRNELEGILIDGSENSA